jgi:hypothetical protein
MQIRVGRTRPTARRPRCALTRFREPAGACTPPGHLGRDGHLSIVLHDVDRPKAINPQAVRAFYDDLDGPTPIKNFLTPPSPHFHLPVLQ